MPIPNPHGKGGEGDKVESLEAALNGSTERGPMRRERGLAFSMCAVTAFGLILAGCTKRDECRNPKRVTIYDTFSGTTTTYDAATCSGRVKCRGEDWKVVAPFDGVYDARGKSCSEKYRALNPWDGNCQLELDATLICLDPKPAPGSPGDVQVTVGAGPGATGGDFPRSAPAGQGGEGGAGGQGGAAGGGG